MAIKRKYFILIVILIILIAIISYFLMHKKSHNLELSGRLEGYETDIGTKTGGRIDYVVAREGARVHKGELLVKLDDSDLQARLKAANNNIEIAEQQKKQAELQLNIAQNQISQAKYSLYQSKGDSSGTIYQAKASVSSAEAQYLQAQEQLKIAISDLSLASTDLKRYTNLSKNCSIPKHTYDIAKTKYDNAALTHKISQEGLNVAQKQIDQAKGLLTQATSSEFNPYIKTEQVNSLQTQQLQAKSQFEAAKSNLLKSQANKQEILAQIAYLNVTSPIDGIIIARTVEPGEIVGVGSTLLTLLNLNTVYMRGYIPEGKIGLVRVGQKAKVYLDSAPDKGLDAFVSQIDIEASFTPENIYFRDDRVKQVFGVKLNIINPKGYAKPGMPADAVIFLDKNKE